MTITIAPQTEAKLKEMASREGREVNALADDLLAAVVEAADRDFEESCEGIAESLASDPKQDIPFEVYRAQFEAEREARRHTREGVKSKGVKDKVAA